MYKYQTKIIINVLYDCITYIVPNGISYFCVKFIVWYHIYLVRLIAKELLNHIIIHIFDHKYVLTKNIKNEPNTCEVYLCVYQKP